MTATMSLEEYHAQRLKHTRTKFRNRRVVHNGHKFDSLAERDRYIELTWLQDQGRISGLDVHPTYVVHDAFEDRNGKQWQAIKYVADFKYQEDGQTVVEDVKGGKITQTPLFRVKLKMFLKRYPELVFRMVET